MDASASFACFRNCAVGRSHGEALTKVGFTGCNWKKDAVWIGFVVRKRVSWEQIFERVGQRRKELTIRLLAS
jgi:hypothetical protein